MTIFSILLLSTMCVTSVAAQQRVVSINAVDWFRYGEISVNCSSNDTNSKCLPPDWEWLEEMFDTDRMLISVEKISGTNITGQMVTHFYNETEKIKGGCVDVDTGQGDNATIWAISACLNADDTIHSSGELST